MTVIHRLPDPPIEVSRTGRAARAGRTGILVASMDTPAAWVLDAPSMSWRRCDPPAVACPYLTLQDGSVWCRSSAGDSIFDPTAESWTPAPPAPDVHQPIPCVLDDEVLLVGGFGPDKGSSWRGDPRTGQWRRVAPIPLRRLAHGTAVVAPWNGEARVMVAGHNNMPDQAQSERIDVYDPASDTWCELACPDAARMGAERQGTWGVVADLIVCGSFLVAPLASRTNAMDHWSVRPVPRFAMLDLSTARWNPSLRVPSDVLTSFSAAACLRGDLVCPGWRGLYTWDGISWTRISWGDGVGLGFAAMVTLADGRAVVFGRDSAFLVDPGGT